MLQKLNIWFLKCQRSVEAQITLPYLYIDNEVLEKVPERNFFVSILMNIWTGLSILIS